MSRLVRRVQKLEGSGGRRVIIVDCVRDRWPEGEEEAFIAAEVARQGGGSRDLVVVICDPTSVS